MKSDTDAVVDQPSEELRAWLSAIGTLSAAVNADHDLKSLLDLVAVTATDLLRLSFCAVMLPDREGKFMTVAGSSGLPEHYIARINEDGPVRLGVGMLEGAPASRAYRTGRPCAVADIHSEPAASWSDIARRQGYRSILAVPLLTSNGVLGTLNSYRKTPHEFTGQEVERLGLLAEHATIALTSNRILDDLREKHQLVVRSEDIHDRLLEVAVRSGGVGGIATALRELLDSAVVVLDEHGAAIASDPSQSAALDDADKLLPTSRVRRSSLVCEVGTHVVADVKLEGDTVASVWLIDRAGDLDPLGVRALEHASVVLSLEILRQRTAAQVEQTLRGELIADLLAGAEVSSAAIQDRARLMGHNLASQHSMLVAGLDRAGKDRKPALFDVDLAQRAAREAIRLSSHLSPRPLVAEVRGAVVALWPEDETSRGGEQILRQAFAIVQKDAAATVATRRITEDGIPAAYRETRGALAFAAADGTRHPVVTLDDLGAAGLLLQYAEPAQLQLYAERTIGPLRRYDSDRGASLVQTLRVYLECDLDRRATGEALVLHPNTVSQRLRKIEALTGLNLQSPRSVIEARTAFMLTDVVEAVDF